jgi:regulator of sigma E protease
LGFNLNSIWQTLLLLSILVVVHEFGHFITARLFGVTVYEFSVGFGPIIAKIKRKGIQYSFRWILLGGFCKIAGMDIALEGEAENPEENEGNEQVCPFYSIAYWKKVIVIAAGPFFNVFLGVLLAFVLYAFIGYPNGLKDNPVVFLASPGTPAFEAGIRPGDRITALDGQPVQKWVQIPKIIQKLGSKKIKVDLLRGTPKTRLVKYIVPEYNEVYKRYIIGIEGETSFKRLPVNNAAYQAIMIPWYYYQSIKLTFQTMIAKKQAKGAFMGPIGMTAVIEQYASLPLIHIIYKFLELGISINMCLFLFNMLPLPLPLLDGGWIVIMTLEKLMRREFSANQKAGAQMVGIVAVLLLGVVIAYGDVLLVIKRFFGG